MDINNITVPAVPPTNGKRFSYDPTINLGHILTFIGFMASGFIAYNTLDKRITVQEQLLVTVTARSLERDSDVKERLGEIKADVKDLARGVADLARIQNKK
jgi:hypothetical protein